MIIAIDESGSFNPTSPNIAFFTSVQIRQRKTLYRTKRVQFDRWERDIPRALKDHKGEIKGAALTDQQLAKFAQIGISSHPPVWLTLVGIRPIDNPLEVLDKHRHVQWFGIRKGIDCYSNSGRQKLAMLYDEFSHWFKNLSSEEYFKVILLGECIVRSLNNAIGKSIVGKYDDELSRLRFLIDRDFVRENRSNTFWHELMRNQLYAISKRNPIIVIEEWEKRGHPFVEKYKQKGYYDLNELFWKHLDFVNSHEYFEVRIADLVGTIVYRYYNKNICHEAFRILYPFIVDKVMLFQLKDFDLSQWKYDPNANPWKQMM